jgi:hypothetical protein
MVTLDLPSRMPAKIHRLIAFSSEFVTWVQSIVCHDCLAEPKILSTDFSRGDGELDMLHLSIGPIRAR